MNAGRVLDALRRRYPHPAPNPEWVSQCVDSLVADGRDGSYENVLAEYLDSDLAETTLHGVMPQPDEEDKIFDAVLFPQPTVVQLHSITEIGASAFALNTAREQRREVLSGATRIRGIDDDEDDIDDSKLPAYPRSMLSFEVSDGRTAIRAIEYRRLQELELGETRLGLKFVLHKAKMLRGTLLLEPQNCTIVGGCVDALEDGQPQAFVEGLEKRLHDAKENPTHMTQPARGRRRTLPVRGTASTTSTRARAARPTPARGTSATARAPAAASDSAARAARAAAIRAAMENPDPPEAPQPPRERARAAPVTQATVVPSSATAGPSSGSFANPTVISDDEDEFGDLDDSFLLAVDAVEAAAAASASRTRSQTQRSSGRSAIPADAEIIELSDSD